MSEEKKPPETKVLTAVEIVPNEEQLLQQALLISQYYLTKLMAKRRNGEDVTSCDIKSLRETVGVLKDINAEKRLMARDAMSDPTLQLSEKDLMLLLVEHMAKEGDPKK